MNGIDPEVVRKVRQWLSFGDEDLRLARHALTLSSGCPYRLLAYHAQQCAEKHLKALLVFRGIDFPPDTTSLDCWSYVTKGTDGPNPCGKPRN